MDNKELADRTVEWIRDKVLAAGCLGVVAGMSGGIDSSLLAVLCYRAFPQSMLGVIMPCYSCGEDETHARDVASQFSIQTETVVLDSAYDSLLQALPAMDEEPRLRQLAEAGWWGGYCAPGQSCQEPGKGASPFPGYSSVNYR
jgi:NAD+ synthase